MRLVFVFVLALVYMWIYEPDRSVNTDTGYRAQPLSFHRLRPKLRNIFSRKKSQNTVHLSVSILLLLTAGDIESNPGPRNTNQANVFPCGLCEFNVTGSAVCCDSCDIWYHRQCMEIGSKDFELLSRPHVSWVCYKCDSMNCSSFTFHMYELDKLNESNYYAPLQDCSIDSFNSAASPLFTSSPLSTSDTDRSRSKSGAFPFSVPNKGKQNLRILTVNCRSVVNKRSELAAIIDYVKPDVVCGTESWLHAGVSSSEVFPENFMSFRKDRSKIGGGVFILVHKSLISEEVILETNAELLWVRLRLIRNKDVFIGSFYMPQRSQQPCKELSESLQHLNSTPNNRNIILCGDFNCPDINWTTGTVNNNANQGNIQQMVIDLASESSLTQIHNQPTREQALLDLVFTTNPSLAKNSVSIPGVSDHSIVVTDFDLKPSYVRKPPRKCYVYKRANWEGLQQDLDKTSKEVNEMFTNGDNAETLWSYFRKETMDAVDRHIPSRLSSSKPKTVWLNRSIRKLLKTKAKLYTQAKRTKNWSNYRHMQKVCRRQIRKAEWNHVNNIIEQGMAEKNNKPFWSYIKRKRQDNIGVSPLRERGGLVTNSQGKANILLKQFQSVFNKKTCIPPPSTETYDTIGPLVINKEGVAKLLKSVKTNKACGPDGIPNIILKSCADNISLAMTCIFQRSLSGGELPSDWLKANISCIFKKGDRHDPSNYRPISLTSVPCKLLEHIVYRHIMDHLENNEILSNLNHGFRSGYSCESQLLVTYNDLAKHFDSGKQTDIVILDMSKAFDTVPHNILLKKLHNYGIRGPIHRWINTFLGNRLMRVVVDGENSEFAKVESGVPQGTVLGPLLFLVHINNISDGIQSQMRLFADDCLIYKTIEQENDHHILQKDLLTLDNWTKANGMSFNAAKCNVMSVRNKSIKFYELDNTILKTVSSNPYLGVEISNDLKWTTHINKTTKRANSTLGFIRRNLKGCSFENRKTAYIALVRSVLEYGSVVWNPNNKRDTERLEGVQRCAARFVCGDYSSRTPGCVTDMLGRLNLPSIQRRRQDKRLNYMFRVVKGLVPAINPSDFYKSAHKRRSIRIKQRQDFLYNSHNPLNSSVQNNSQPFVVPTSNSEQYKNSFFVSTVVNWNHLTDIFVNSDTPEQFGRQMAIRGSMD